MRTEGGSEGEGRAGGGKREWGRKKEKGGMRWKRIIKHEGRKTRKKRR